MKRLLYISLSIVIIAISISGCSDSNIRDDILGTWLLTSLENRETGEECEFDSELYIFNDNATGYNVVLPCEYYEELYYTTWRALPLFNEIKIKYYKDYTDNIMIKDIEKDSMTCYINYEDGDEVLKTSASLQKIPDEMAPFIGCWWLFEKYQNEEYIEFFEEYLYLYPNGDMKLKYYINGDWVNNSGEWKVKDELLYLNIFDENGEFTELSREYDLYGNIIKLFDNSNENTKLAFVYKREFGNICNSPPSGVK